MNQETKHPPSAAIGPAREFAPFGGEQFAASALLESLAAADRHDAPIRAELRRSLIGLEAALYRHFDEQNQVFVPLLEHLTPRESDALARQLEHAAVKGHEQ